MRIIGMILTGLICLLSIACLIHKVSKEKMSTSLLILLFVIINLNGLAFLILLGLSLKL